LLDEEQLVAHVARRQEAKAREVECARARARKTAWCPSASARSWIERYLNEVRPKLVVPPDSGTLFLGVTGEQLSPDTVSKTARAYVQAADIGKQGACHIFRHTMATLMLENGADIRYI
jgi:integrase/recombinase XerD